jgi:hypothetical protein
MLVHTTVRAIPHLSFQAPLLAYRDRLARGVEADSSIMESLRELWEREQALVPSHELGRQPVSFDALSARLEGVMRDTEIVVENSLSDARVDYSRPGRRYVVVGGNVLARGLTLEGLIVSFFLRSSSAYDSLMQMGRWFGYRPNYEDLPRVWMSQEMQGYFRDLATVEQEIRNDISRYELEGVTPMEFGVRIRTHPQLAITARNKMLQAVPTDISFAGRLLQTTKFHLGDPGWVQGNWVAGDRLVRAARELSKDVRTSDTRWIFRGVPVDTVRTFLEEYRVSEHHVELRVDKVLEYIERQNAESEQALAVWNVAVIGSGARTYGQEPLGDGVIGLIGRSRFLPSGDPGSITDIKALVSKNDLVADFDPPVEPSAFRDRPEMHEARRPGGAEERAVVLLYPIAKDSRPYSKTARTRAPLDAPHHVMGLALVFPKTLRDTPLRYLTVALPTDQWEEPELASGRET